ncbi:MAG: glycosyltransferase family 4 protein [Betaproteobacteria bacterium]|nr:glycosyltransferase family 4 protein [Betaproteobacteria bacterium]
MAQSNGAPVKVVLLSNNPTPFRIPVFQMMGSDPRIDFTAIFCARREPGRPSDVPELPFKHVILKERYRIRDDAYSVHNNPDVVGVLRRLAPDVVINSGFQPTNIYAFLYTLLSGRRHVVAIDGTVESEVGLRWPHRALRKLFFRFSQAFVGPNNGTRRLYETYGVPASSFFRSPLGVDNARFRLSGVEKRHDLLFCSRLTQIKRPLFALDMAELLAKKLGREVTLLYVGAGPMEEAVRERAASATGVRTTFAGFTAQADLPRLYNEARVFLFPTSWDPWGVVANEACASGLPVIVTPHAGVVGEIVEDGVNGFVLEADPPRWTEAAMRLLADQALYDRFSANSRDMVKAYTYEAAAMGFIDAALHAFGREPEGRARSTHAAPGEAVRGEP